MRVEEIDALLGGEAQRLADQYTSVPLDFMDGYGWALTQICRLFPDAVPVIRCKDCKWYEAEFGCDWGVCSHEEWTTGSVGNGVDCDGYCFRAERKED